MVLLSGLSLLIFRVLVGHFFGDFSGLLQVYGEVDELRVLFDEVADGAFLSEFDGVLLEMDGHSGATAESVAARVLGNGELVSSLGFPDILVVLEVL